jgi:serine/threonine-protein kinase
LALAEAMQAAHEAGIVHRDLKPAIVLLTADGTPKVADFGLARRLDDERLTLSGAVLGTPGYASPEQARGDRGAIGPRTDVYALGAVLYECLTGRPPFRAETAAATLLQVVADEPIAPRLLNPEVPRDLETVCLKCLYKEPERRYQSAREMADDLRRWLDGEPILARPAGLVERAWRWVRRHPATVTMLAAVALVAAAGAVGAWQFYQQRADAVARQDRADQEVRALLERGRCLLDEGWLAADVAKVTQARGEAGRAVDVAHNDGASAALRQEAEAFRDDASARLERVEKGRTLLEGLQDASAPLETLDYVHGKAGRPMPLAQPGADEQYAAAFRRWGLDVDEAPEAEVVARLGAEPGPVVQEVVAGLDSWMLERRRQKRPEAQWRRLYRVADQLDRSERRRRLRAMLVDGQATPRAEGVAGVVGAGSPWLALLELGHGHAYRPLPELKRKIDPRTEPALTVLLLASACAAGGDEAGAERVLRLAVTARPEEVVLLGALGKLLERQGRAGIEEAIGYYRAARGRRRHLGLALSKALFVAGKADQAEEVLRELALGGAHKDNPALPFYLGAVRWHQGRFAEAEAAWREAIRLRPGWGPAHANLGAALNGQRKYAEAEAACRKALDVAPDGVDAYSPLGIALLHQEKFAQAEAAFRKSLGLRPGLAGTHVNLGTALLRQGKYAEAEAACRKALDLSPDFTDAHMNLGTICEGQKRYGEAEAAFNKVLELTPGSPVAFFNLGLVLLRQARFEEATEYLRKALERTAKTDLIHEQAARLERQCQRFMALRHTLPGVLEGKKPATAVERLEFAMLCRLERRYGAAARLYREAFAADARLAELVPLNTRYVAACVAALAGCGQGKDADPTEEGRARWRRQALVWLRQDLAWWGRAVGRSDAQAATARLTLRHWLMYVDLAGVREREALARLPKEERQAWQRLWSDVDALIRRASKPE